MKLVFCGTPEFAVPALQAVTGAGHNVELVITQPDRSSGRGLAVAEPPVKRAARVLGVPVIQPDKVKNNLDLRARLEAIAPDAILIVAFGRIIPRWMLEIPQYGNINLHGSLLPKYRGAAPIQWAIANGETETGVTTMRIDEGLDTGDMLLRRSVPIPADATAQDLYPVLANVGAELMIHTLEGLQAGTIQPRSQDHSAATYAPILTREDGRVDLTRDARTIYNRWRGFQPWPGAHATFRNKNLSITRMRLFHLPPSEATALLPGELLVLDGALIAGCAGNMPIELVEVQLEGKKRVTGIEFARGYRPRPGERLGLLPESAPASDVAAPNQVH